MYDNICKFIAEEFSTDLASWLLGEPIQLTQLSPKELSIEPIRTDALILQQSNNLVLHVEFQTKTEATIPFRMTDYRLRVYRRYPDKEMHQVVIYLKQTASELVYQNTFALTRTRHEFEVIRLWEQPTEQFLNSPGLLPFAVLSRTDEKVEVLREVARRVEAISDRQVQSNVGASAFILAGLVLEKEIIQTILRRDIMEESVTYQELRREAREQGLQEGRIEGLQQGLQQGFQQVALNLLRSGMSLEQVANFTGLSVEQVTQLQLTSNQPEPPVS
ncbi:MAG: Rpn family recombination-promoting nuclease/putative transposase, partial [Limnoraphis robusta]